MQSQEQAPTTDGVRPVSSEPGLVETPALDTRERELKLEVSPTSLRALGAALGRLEGAQRRGPAARLASTYFDTVGHDLLKAGVSLRIRRKGRGRTQTIKKGEGGAGFFDRLELERPVRGDEPSLTSEESAALATMLGRPLLPEDALAPVFVTQVKRTIYDVERGDLSLEIAIDDAVIETGERRATFCELEIELKAGDPAGMFAIVRELSGVAALRLSVHAKSRRGYALLAEGRRRAAKAKPAPIQPGMNVEAAFLAVVSDCVAQFRDNEDILLREPGEKAVHQARVALRRLRSGISMFRPILPSPETLALAQELRWLAGALGDARDLDVFAKDRLVVEGAAVEPDPAAAALAARVAARRDEAYAQAVANLRSKRAVDLMLSLAKWSAIGAWRMQRSTAEARAATIESFAATVLDDRLRKLHKKAKALLKLAPEKRHEARIEAKKLRYACDFFADLYTGKQAKKHKAFVGVMADLQDKLGLLNDISTARRLTAELAREAVDDHDADLAFSAGLVAGRAQADAARLIDRAQKNMAVLLDAKPFWR